MWWEVSLYRQRKAREAGIYIPIVAHTTKQRESGTCRERKCASSVTQDNLTGKAKAAWFFTVALFSVYITSSNQTASSSLKASITAVKVIHIPHSPIWPIPENLHRFAKLVYRTTPALCPPPPPLIPASRNHNLAKAINACLGQLSSSVSLQM